MQRLWVWILLLSVAGCANTGGGGGPRGEGGGPADSIFRGGAVITLDSDSRVVEALAVRDGRIAALGSEAEVRALQGPATQIIDLAGGALLPGFIDAHGHLTGLARYASTANVAPPPVGAVGTIDDLQAEIRRFIDENQVPPGEWVLATGYDDGLMAEQRHPTRFDLDEISTEHPILALHVSLHLASANSRALALSGVTADTPDLPSGIFRRVEGSREPNGVMEEHAMFVVFTAAFQPTSAQLLGDLVEAQKIYASHGFTTVQDGATDVASFELLLAAEQQGLLFLDVLTYPKWTDFDAVLAAAPMAVGESQGHLKLAGAKLVLDGSPQGKTAWLSEPYHVPPSGQGSEYRGYPALEDEAVYAFAVRLRREDWPILAHANGDEAAAQWLRTVERIEKEEGQSDWRPVMIHAQALRRDQLPQVALLGIVPSFFVSHTFYWGDWHRDSVFGPERGSQISPARSALEQGVRFTIHNDAPVVPPDGTFLLWTAVNRITRSGEVLGADERLTVEQALRAMTSTAAYQGFEEHEKGSLEAGKIADLVVLSSNPLTVDPMALREIEVVRTIKDGETVWPSQD